MICNSTSKRSKCWDKRSHHWSRTLLCRPKTCARRSRTSFLRWKRTSRGTSLIKSKITRGTSNRSLLSGARRLPSICRCLNSKEEWLHLSTLSEEACEQTYNLKRGLVSSTQWWINTNDKKANLKRWLLYSLYHTFLNCYIVYHRTYNFLSTFYFDFNVATFKVNV